MMRSPRFRELLMINGTAFFLGFMIAFLLKHLELGWH